uniref:Uncharacterized protein n=1 Tax=Escherichia coli TaxID=562 RepID=A0A411JIG0_ECOLX|nr:hypothetical protein [Escherichia coli]AZQ22383.1 hypothetical protein [Escherichia coli]QBC36052.1 hypothetical protein [Escherichia coli]
MSNKFFIEPSRVSIYKSNCLDFGHLNNLVFKSKGTRRLTHVNAVNAVQNVLSFSSVMMCSFASSCLSYRF